MIDRGGFRYTIKAEDQFSAAIRRMREEVAGLKRDLGGLATARAGVANAQRAADTEEKARAKEAKARAREELQSLQRLADNARKKADLERLNAAAFKNENRERAKSLKDQERASKQAALEARRLANEQARASREAAIAAKAAARETARASKEAARIQREAIRDQQRAAAAFHREQIRQSRERERQARREAIEQERASKQRAAGFRRIRDSVLSSGDAANRVSFTFRRLFGILAAFQAARIAGGLFTQGISEGFKFNALLEDTTIGLASLISSLAEVRATADGPILQGGEKFAVSMEIARDQIAKLKVDALATSATFEELLTGFQAGLASGLGEALSLDEIRKVTIGVSQAARALQVPQNQLVEEIRSILTGTGRQTTTRIQFALNISNPQIKQWQEAGTLAQELTDRLFFFGVAADKAQQTFSGLSANVQDAFSQITAAASEEAFGQIKTVLQGVLGSLITIDKEAKTAKISMQAVATVKPLYDGLATSLKLVFEQFSSADPRQALSFFQILGDAIVGFTRIALAAARGVGNGFSDLRRIVTGIASAFGGVDTKSLETLVSLITRALTVAVGLSTAFAAVRLVLVGLVGPFALVTKLLLATTRGLVTFGTALFTVGKYTVAFARAMLSVRTVLIGGVLGALVAAGVGITNFGKDVTGLNVTFTETIKLIADNFAKLGPVILGTLQIVGLQISVFFQDIFAGIFDDVINGLANALQGLADQLPEFLAASRAPLENASRLFRDLSTGIRRGTSITKQALTDAQVELGTAMADLTIGLQESADADPSIGQGGGSGIGGFFNGIVEGADLALGKIQDFAGGVKDTLGDLPTSIAGINAELDAALDSFFGKEELPAFAAGETAADAYERGFAQGIKGNEGEKDPLREYLNGLITNFETGLSILRPAIQNFSSFISDSIVDAFDPTSDTDILERFARFLQSLAKIIIETLTQIAVAAAVLKILGGPAQGLQSGGPVGTPPSFAEGGEIPHGHSTPRSLRPKGIDPRDTTMIFAQPEEYMLRKSAAKKYGRERLDALNAGRIDPSALDAAIGKKAKRHVSGLATRRGIGYVTGGSIAAPRRQSSSESSGGTATLQAPAPAYLVANDQTLDKLLNGGRQAFLRFIGDNANAVDSTLQKVRRK